MRKKYITMLFCILIAFDNLTACGSEQKKTEDGEKGEKISIVTTIFPEYDWVLEILGENDYAEVTLLLDGGVDLHSYQPTADDIIKIKSCDLCIYIGGESDKWVGEALREAANQDMIALNLLEALGDGAKEEEIAEGMETEASVKEDEGEETEYDEHIWLSMQNAQILCSAIADALSELDPVHADTYRTNAADYNDRLSALDAEYVQAIKEGRQNVLLFGDRFPFRYLADDYGLNYYAAFPGCSTESEASFETILFLANKVDELGLNTVLTIENSDEKIARTIISATNGQDQQVLSLDSMQASAPDDADGGTTYLSVMQNNLEVLREALK